MLPAVSPVVADRHLPVWIGVDASVKRDSTAIVACTWDDEAKNSPNCRSPDIQADAG